LRYNEHKCSSGIAGWCSLAIQNTKLFLGTNMSESRPLKTVAPWRQKLWVIIFESDTPLGKAFDIILLFAILASVLVVLVESTPGLDAQTVRLLLGLEFFFTIMFSIEYVLRVVSVRRPVRYMISFYGIVDLLAVAPTYISLFVPGAQYFLVIRTLRLLRVFRVLKLGAYLTASEYLARALRASRIKIGVFLFAIFNIVVIVGAIVYVIEGPENGFQSIPLSIYWAVVTMTTVGYGDLVPQTTLGRALATVVMLIGYSIIAVPTGIVSVELYQQPGEEQRAARLSGSQVCTGCGRTHHDGDAIYCKYCGSQLKAASDPEST
jgi:voltage-gated potassium channel